MQSRVASALFDTFFGLPLHPLVVHAAVVLVPLAAIGAIAMAISPRFSRRFGTLVVLVAGAGFAASFVAKESGEAFIRRAAASVQHVELGDRLPLFAFVLAAGVTGFWLVDRGIPGNRRRPWWVKIGAVVLVVIAALATIWTVRVGHSGAESAWGSLVR
jgi:hypothetical protein